MRVEYINPFITSLKRVFKTMLDAEAHRGEPYLRTGAPSGYCVSGVIGLSGQAAGTLVLNFSEEVALRAASTMLLTEARQIDADVVDAIGELTNIIAGMAKSQLDQFELMISLPNVITGEGHSIHFPSTAMPICVPFETSWGPVMMEVGLVPVAKPVAAEASS